MKWLTLTVTLVLSHYCFSQFRSEKLVYLDGSGNNTKEKNAVIMEQRFHPDDTTWVVNVYRMDGPMISSNRYKDEGGTILHGSYRAYNAEGWIDTLGSYANGKRSGIWGIYSGGHYLGQQSYKNGVLEWQKDSLQLNRERDSAKKARDTGAGNTFTKVEIESEFPGGAKGWLKYLNTHMHYPDRAVRKKIQGEVVIGFIVGKDGKIDPLSIWVDRSVEYSLDKETWQIILESPDWKAAMQNGRPVKSYKKQPMVFKLNRN